MVVAVVVVAVVLPCSLCSACSDLLRHEHCGSAARKQTFKRA
jgi:hypothetical protein